MKRWAILYFIGVLSLLKANAQNEYVNWYFGNNIGLNFCNGLRVSEVSQFQEYVTSATISDKGTGKMLIHTNGDTVWNSQYSVIQNGTGLKSNTESSQGALIVPQPGNDSIYYLFTTGGNPFPEDSLEYSIVNIKSNNGLGTVISKNNFLHISCEQLTAVYSATGSFYWILSLDSNNFLEYKLDETGLNSQPAFYFTNVIFSSWGMSSGFVKASPNASFLACTFEQPDTAALYHFNNTTGEIAFITKLQLGTNDYNAWSLSFSPNSSKLYVGTYTGAFSNIYQYDVTSGNPITINNSMVTIYSYNYVGNGHVFGAFQLGPDKKLYISHVATDSLCVIDYPDSTGLACNFKFNAIYLDGLTSAWGLSNNIDNLYEWAQPPSLSVATNSHGCNGVGNFTITASKNFNNYEVSYGDGTDTTLDSLQFTGTHQYTAEGNYTITVRGRLGCVYDSVSAAISIPAPCVYPLVIPTLIYSGGSQTQWRILNLPSNAALTLYDELGRIIYKTSNYLNNYDMRNLSPAMYFYRLDLQNGGEYKGKIVVVK